MFEFNFGLREALAERNEFDEIAIAIHCSFHTPINCGMKAWSSPYPQKNAPFRCLMHGIHHHTTRLCEAAPPAGWTGAGGRVHRRCVKQVRYARTHISASGGGNPSKPSKDSSLGNLRSVLRNQNKGTSSNLGILSLTNFLKTELCITREPELRRIIDIMTNKNSLYGSKGGSGRQAGNPYARMVTVDEAQMVVNCMEEFGFATSDVKQLVIAFPQVLCYSVERVQGLLNYFVTTAGIDGDEVKQMMLARPTILGLPREQIEQIVGFLVENGSSREEIVMMLQKTL